MRRLVCLVLIVCGLGLASGCVQATKDIETINRSVTRGLTQDRSMTESYAEHLHRLNAIVDHDARGLVEDWDLLLQRHRRNRLSRWHMP